MHTVSAQTAAADKRDGATSQSSNDPERVIQRHAGQISGSAFHGATTNIDQHPGIYVFLGMKLTSIRSLQSALYGYSGMVEQLEVYIPTGEQAWEDFPDPRNTRPHTDGTLNSIQQKDM